jgi:hypothetical protein
MEMHHFRVSVEEGSSLSGLLAVRGRSEQSKQCLTTPIPRSSSRMSQRALDNDVSADLRHDETRLRFLFGLMLFMTHRQRSSLVGQGTGSCSVSSVSTFIVIWSCIAIWYINDPSRNGKKKRLRVAAHATSPSSELPFIAKDAMMSFAR